MPAPSPFPSPQRGRGRGEGGFPHSFYLLLADFKVVPVPGEDFDRDAFIVLGILEVFQNLFEIDDPGANWEMAVFFSEVVIGVHVADAKTIKTDKLRGFILAASKVGVAHI